MCFDFEHFRAEILFTSRIKTKHLHKPTVIPQTSKITANTIHTVERNLCNPVKMSASTATLSRFEKPGNLQAQSPFYTILPAEIRTRIYHMVLDAYRHARLVRLRESQCRCRSPMKCEHENPDQHAEHRNNILAVCQMMNHEAMAAFFRGNEFHFQVGIRFLDYGKRDRKCALMFVDDLASVPKSWLKGVRHMEITIREDFNRRERRKFAVKRIQDLVGILTEDDKLELQTLRLHIVNVKMVYEPNDVKMNHSLSHSSWWRPMHKFIRFERAVLQPLADVRGLTYAWLEVSNGVSKNAISKLSPWCKTLMSGMSGEKQRGKTSLQGERDPNLETLTPESLLWCRCLPRKLVHVRDRCGPTGTWEFGGLGSADVIFWKELRLKWRVERVWNMVHLELSIHQFQLNCQ
ncbi:hypothetical protein NA57DRAFT_61066 [Rhizodiscina lignyota]|uniref:DUF7730 domain-containing protein n=1 Tax=Rhizodiscina lignyota TaxID=1504668 RepID=A0A9P4I2I7_9PEZI|nr:hypothetical protein NA57DRAFT_61066 [Rhizodiscina lignyota]